MSKDVPRARREGMGPRWRDVDALVIGGPRDDVDRQPWSILIFSAGR
jgi:hypothetical protein